MGSGIALRLMWFARAVSSLPLASRRSGGLRLLASYPPACLIHTAAHKKGPQRLTTGAIQINLVAIAELGRIVNHLLR